jgi:hypothetical protein
MRTGKPQVGGKFDARGSPVRIVVLLCILRGIYSYLHRTDGWRPS